jgi:tripartite-type tricarboxylate transporter receptor subunit TctC
MLCRMNNVPLQWMKKAGVLGVSGASALLATMLHAAGPDSTLVYPTKPIRFLVPYAPGAGTDTAARTLSAKLAERWSQQIIVDNRSGASGALAVEAAVNANPDGHTIVLITNSQAVGQASGVKVPYDLTRDLQSVTQVLSVFYVVYVPTALPVKSIRELVAHAKAHPGKLNFGSSGAGSLQHVGTELFNQTAGIKLVHVPYKGSAGMITGMLANEIQVGMNSLFSVRPPVQAGRLRWLATTAAKRSPVVDLPTVAESGVPGYEVEQWYGIAAPVKVRKPVVAALHAAFTQALQATEVVQRLTADGSALIGSTPEQFGDLIQSEIAKWTKLVKAANIPMQ